MTFTRVVPLGGLGEVGMNCLALESPEGIVVIDCGVTFPHGDLGVEILHPDFQWLWERRDDVLGVLVTHGHEDHIGALPYLLQRIPVPVWAPPYAITLIRHRLQEHPDVPPVAINPTRPREKFKLGGYTVEPLRVTHSIPDATALSIDTPAGRIFHTGDFKLESDPVDNEASDEDRFRELGEDGVALLLSDSTNIDVPGTAGRERDAGAALAELISQMQGRVVVGLFASNVFRLQMLVDAAMKNDRRVCFVGRSVQTHVRAAMDLGRLKVPSDRVVSLEQAQSVRPREMLAIATGTQAERQSVLARIARDEYPKLRLERGDSVVFSSRAIPGNERAIQQLVSDLERRGLEVVFQPHNSTLHVSGHAARDEQRRMIEMIRPQSFLPVHGTFHHLRHHARLAEQLGVRSVRVIENGQTARLADGALHEDESVPFGRIAIDQNVPLGEDVLGEREALADAGVVIATVAVDSRGRLLSPPIISTRGVLLDGAFEELATEAREAIASQLIETRGLLDTLSPDDARAAVRRAMRRVFRVGAKRPIVVVHLTSLSA